MSNDELIIDNVLIAFMDTSAIDPMYNDYRNMEHQFAALKKHIESNKLTILTHEIAVKEMENHIREEVAKQIEKLIAVKNTKELVLLKSIPKYENFFLDVQQEEIIDDSIKALKSKLKEVGFSTLKTGNISVKDLLHDYFFSNPPFGVKGKKAEFPDAIMLQSLIKAIGKEQKIHIVAKDGDWNNVRKTHKNIVIHKNIAMLLDYINKDNKASSAIKSFLTQASTSKYINVEIKDIVESIDYEVDGLTYDRKGISEGYSYEDVELLRVDDVSYVIDTIDDITCSDDMEYGEIEAIVTIVGSAHVTLNCSYFDEGNSVWDSEEHEYIYKQYGNVIETHEFLFPLRLTITGDYKNKLQVDECVLVQAENFALLDSTTLIDREYISDYYDYGFHVVKILECPHCKNEIKVDLISDATDCVRSSERQMGFEREYNVDVNGYCPICKNEYQITGEIWEYPENCFNYEQGIEIRKVN